jgi:tRNA nucleotidyltransferase (CCA-adding enzyme)
MHLKAREIEFLNERLHFPADLLKVLHSAASLNANSDAVVGLKPSQVVELLDSYSIKAVEVISVATSEEKIRMILSNYLSDWWHVKPKTTGHDLKKLGVPPGPKYAEILRRLRAAWLDGEIKSDEEEKTLLNSLLERA